MPFTLAHPAIVIGLPRRYFHHPALILGAMSPDFGYFLAGKPVGGGHTLWGSEWLNLPLVALFYLIYRLLLAKPLQDYLPRFLASNPPPFSYQNPFVKIAVFFFSAWIGMASHIFLDNFTHVTGSFVVVSPFLQQTVGIFPMYKWLQYAGGVLGLAVMLGYFWRLAYKYPHISDRSPQQKIIFWLWVFGLAALFFGGWQKNQPLNQLSSAYAILIIRLIDCFCVALVGVCMAIFCKNLNLGRRHD